VTDRLEKIEKTLEEHGSAILDLQESNRRLEGGQERQAVAIQELSNGFGQVLGELGKVGDEYRRGKKEILSTMQNLSDAVVRIDTNQSAFRREWSGVCDGKHKHIDYRLDMVESMNSGVVKKVEDMSDESKIYYIKNLEGQLGEKMKAEAQIKKDEAADKRFKRSDNMKLIGLIIGGLLTGTGGTIIIQWLLGG